MNDCHLLNTFPIKWNPAATNFNGPPLAWHTACLVLPSEIANSPRVSIYKFPEEKIGRRSVVKVKKHINYNKIIYLDKRKRNLSFWRKI